MAVCVHEKKLIRQSTAHWLQQEFQMKRGSPRIFPAYLSPCLVHSNMNMEKRKINLADFLLDCYHLIWSPENAQCPSGCFWFHLKRTFRWLIIPLLLMSWPKLEIVHVFCVIKIWCNSIIQISLSHFQCFGKIFIKPKCRWSYLNELNSL